MTDPTNVLGTKILRQAQIAEKLRPELEKDAAKLAMFDHLVEAFEVSLDTLSTLVGNKEKISAGYDFLKIVKELQK